MNVALAWSRDAKLAAEMAAEVAAFWIFLCRNWRYVMIVTGRTLTSVPRLLESLHMTRLP